MSIIFYWGGIASIAMLCCIIVSANKPSNASYDGHADIANSSVCGTDQQNPLIEELLQEKKYRNIHHDTFCREENPTEIGNNAMPGRGGVMAYGTMNVGKQDIGIELIKKSQAEIDRYFAHTTHRAGQYGANERDPREWNHYATNFKTTRNVARTIKFIKTNTSSFHVSAIRGKSSNCDVKVAFNIRDINNFYFAQLTSRELLIGRYVGGRKQRVCVCSTGGERLEINIDADTVSFAVDQKEQKTLYVQNNDSGLCGLFFDNKSISYVDEFIVDKVDDFCDTGIDSFIERDNCKDGVFGVYCAMPNRCQTSKSVVKSGARSYKFTLKKPSKADVMLNRDNATHSSIMLNGVTDKGGNNGNKPLDSFIFSVDVFFPDNGPEKWELDDAYSDCFIQEHHVGYRIPFSPSLAINIDKGRMKINTIWQEPIAFGTSSAENPTTWRAQYFARINSDEEEVILEKHGAGNWSHLPILSKGEWHNFTMYVKLGYTYNQNPRTLLYVDDELIIDWDTPNAYNCQEYGEYMEFGIYKWDWDDAEKRKNTHINQRVLYFDNIHYFI